MIKSQENLSSTIKQKNSEISKLRNCVGTQEKQITELKSKYYDDAILTTGMMIFTFLIGVFIGSMFY